MHRLLVLLALALLLVSCQLQPVPPPTEARGTAIIGGTPQQQVVSAELAGEQVLIVTQAGWDTLAADDSILLAEHNRSISNSQEVDGILINIFKPQVTGFDVTSSTNDNVALTLLRYIVRDPGYVGNAALTTPRAFDWGSQQAAYYTVYNGADRYTLVIAVDTNRADHGVLVMNVGIPIDQIGVIYDKLSLGIQQIVIGEIELLGTDLDALPNPIPFPSGDLEIATDNTPEIP